MTTTTSRRPPQPVVSADSFRINHVQLAGWGGGPGMVNAISLSGPMAIEVEAATGLLKATCMGPVEVPDYLAERYGAHSRWSDPQRRDKKIYELPLGKVIRFHASHVRIMG